jgi:hypothetical protein
MRERLNWWWYYLFMGGLFPLVEINLGKKSFLIVSYIFRHLFITGLNPYLFFIFSSIIVLVTILYFKALAKFISSKAFYFILYFSSGAVLVYLFYTGLYPQPVQAIINGSPRRFYDTSATFEASKPDYHFGLTITEAVIFLGFYFINFSRTKINSLQTK